MKRYCERIKQTVNIETNGLTFPFCTSHGDNPVCTNSKCRYSFAASTIRLITGYYDGNIRDYTTTGRAA
ncbi:hypothetical protein JW948_14685 [bacterium]|nr:hypothetical protein [bacterium]